MVVINAKIILKNVYNSDCMFINNNLKCAFEMNKKACEVMIQTMDNNSYFFYEKEENARIIMPMGECLLPQLLAEKNFDLYYGKKIGEGVITKILEVYVERDGLELLKDINECKKIVKIAEKMDEALIYEDVYHWLEGNCSIQGNKSC